MKLLLLGGTGGCGVWAARLALERGHEVRAVVREESLGRVPEGVEVVEGSVLNGDVLGRGLVGVEGVVSCLGLRRRNPRNPWSQVVSPPTLTRHVARMLVDLLPQHDVSRLVAISAGGVGDSASQVHPMLRGLFAHSSIAVSYRDLHEMEEILRGSVLDWHAVRPTTLANGPPTGKARVVERYGLFSRIRRADVAGWMLDVIEGRGDPGVSRTPMISA